MYFDSFAHFYHIYKYHDNFSYSQNFDLEGESGIVARGIGTAVTLTKIQDNSIPLDTNFQNE